MYEKITKCAAKVILGLCNKHKRKKFLKTGFETQKNYISCRKLSKNKWCLFFLYPKTSNQIKSNLLKAEGPDGH